MYSLEFNENKTILSKKSQLLLSIVLVGNFIDFCVPFAFQFY